MAWICEVESGCSEVKCTSPVRQQARRHHRQHGSLSTALKPVFVAPNQTNSLSNPAIFYKTLYDTISDSNFRGGGVYCASLSVLAGSALLLF